MDESEQIIVDHDGALIAVHLQASAEAGVRGACGVEHSECAVFESHHRHGRVLDLDPLVSEVSSSAMRDCVVCMTSCRQLDLTGRACAAHRVPVIAFGVGSSLEGHTNAPGGGISLDMARMRAEGVVPTTRPPAFCAASP